jgi:hypothetical protein
VILPEIDHYLDKLSLARHSAGHLCGLQVSHDTLQLTRCTTTIPVRAHAARPITRCRVGSHCLPLAPGSAYFGEQSHHLARLRVQHLEAPHRLFTRIVANAFWIELRGDPTVDAHGPHRCGVARTSTKREAAQRVRDLLVCAELSIGGGRKGDHVSIALVAPNSARRAPGKGEHERNGGTVSLEEELEHGVSFDVKTRGETLNRRPC